MPVTIVGLNYAIHLLYGDHYLVYALHWQTSLLFVMAGVALLPQRARFAGQLALAGFAVITAVNS